MSGRLVGLAAFVTASCVAPQPPTPPVSAAQVAHAGTLAPLASQWPGECADWDEWDKPGPAFRIHGDTYYVGTCGISAVLIAGPHGHVLIDTGTRDGSVVVLENVRALGLHQDQLLAVLTSHEHHDHVGGLWWVAQNSGARVYTSPLAAPVIASGVSAENDPQAAIHPPMHEVDRAIIREVEPGVPITIGGITLTPHATFGHTPGSLTWQWQSCDGSDCKTIVYADSLSAVSADDYRFTDHPEYVEHFRDSFARVAELDCDILLTPHPSASGMRDKLLAGDLSQGMNCREYAEIMDTRLSERLAEEGAQ